MSRRSYRNPGGKEGSNKGFLLPTPVVPTNNSPSTSRLGLLPFPDFSQSPSPLISKPILKWPLLDDTLFSCQTKLGGSSRSSWNIKKGMLEMAFSDDLIHSLRAVKKFEGNSPITSLGFSPNGEYLVSSSQKDIICIYNMTDGVVHRKIPSKKYGVDLVSFSNENTSILHASTKIDDTIRFLDIETNKYIRYFHGHTKTVTQLKVDQNGGSVLSSGHDHRLFLWDVRSPNCQGLLNMNGMPVADFDPEGIIFAVSLNSNTVKLYDMRSFDKGPFSTFTVKDVFIGEYITGLKFAPHGCSIMLYSTEPTVHIIDAFNGSTVKIIEDLNNNGLPVDVNYTPDGNYILAGSWNGNVHIWKAATGQKMCIIKNVHPHGVPTLCVKHNPKFMTMVSASDLTVIELLKKNCVKVKMLSSFLEPNDSWV